MGTVKRVYRALISAAILASIVVFAAVCWHSVEEIHYLKSFYPERFTVEEAFHASAVELIKVTIIGLPISLIVGVGLYLLGRFDKGS